MAVPSHGAGEFGAELRRRRCERGLSLAQLASLVHYSKGYLSRVETGERPMPAELAVRCDEVLEAGGALAARAAAPQPRQRGTGPRPAQLPVSTAYFTGRADALAALNRLLDRVPACGAVVISAIEGTAGVGKTALAVQWAHRVAGQFPDGQLYVNLRGYGPSGPPVSTAEAVRGFLDALGVDPARIPQSLDAQAGLYRSLLAGKRVLVVLDNARDCEQARPLLPGSPGCLALVTSRNGLMGLVADGACPLTLGLLTRAESRDLLAARLGSERVAAEPRAVDELIESCSRLPLALAVIGGRAATSPQLRLAALAAQLRDTRGRLDMLDTGDPATDVRAVLSWSYGHLSGPAARLFRLLGLHPGPDISAPAAASLAGAPPGETARAIAELTRAHLLTEHLPGRYVLHDLLRAYAAEKAQAADDGPDRRMALNRVLDHYLQTAHAAALLLNCVRAPLLLAQPMAGVSTEDLAGREHAAAWFDAEYRVLLAAIAQAAGAGFDSHAWQIPWAMASFLIERGYWRDWLATQQTALAAAERLADPHALACVNHYLGYAHARLGSQQAGRALIERAIGQFGQLGDRVNQAQAYLALASASGEADRPADGLAESRRALELYREAGQLAGQARALNAVGWYHTVLGSHGEAITYCRQALVLLQESGDSSGEAETWDSLGYAHYHLGDHAEAAACYQRALDLCNECGLRDLGIDIHIHIGDTQHAAGDLAAAVVSWRHALGILDDLGHPDAAKVRAKLAAVACGLRMS